MKRYTVDEFATKIKNKYPVYKDIDNETLVKKIVDKYPVYKDHIIFDGGLLSDVTNITKAGLKVGYERLKGAAAKAGAELLDLTENVAGGFAVGFYDILSKAAPDKYAQKIRQIGDEIYKDIKGVGFAERAKNASSEYASEREEIAQKASRDILKDTLIKGQSYDEYMQELSDGDFNIKDIVDRRFWAYGVYKTLLENLPTMAVSAIPGVSLTKLGAIGKAVSSTATANWLNAAQEANFAYDNALKETNDKNLAFQAAENVFNRNFGANSLLEFATWANIFFPSLKTTSKFLDHATKLVRAGATGVFEAGQERIEDEIQRQALEKEMDIKEAIDNVLSPKLTATDAIAGSIGAIFQLGFNPLVENANDRFTKYFGDEIKDTYKRAAEKLGIKTKSDNTDEILNKLSNEAQKDPEAVSQAVLDSAEEVKQEKIQEIQNADKYALYDDAKSIYFDKLVDAYVKSEIEQDSTVFDSLVFDINDKFGSFVTEQLIKDVEAQAQAIVDKYKSDIDKQNADIEAEKTDELKKYEEETKHEDTVEKTSDEVFKSEDVVDEPDIEKIKETEKDINTIVDIYARRVSQYIGKQRSMSDDQMNKIYEYLVGKRKNIGALARKAIRYKAIIENAKKEYSTSKASVDNAISEARKERENKPAQQNTEGKKQEQKHTKKVSATHITKTIIEKNVKPEDITTVEHILSTAPHVKKKYFEEDIKWLKDNGYNDLVDYAKTIREKGGKILISDESFNELFKNIKPKVVKEIKRRYGENQDKVETEKIKVQSTKQLYKSQIVHTGKIDGKTFITDGVILEFEDPSVLNQDKVNDYDAAQIEKVNEIIDGVKKGKDAFFAGAYIDNTLLFNKKQNYPLVFIDSDGNEYHVPLMYYNYILNKYAKDIDNVRFTVYAKDGIDTLGVFINDELVAIVAIDKLDYHQEHYKLLDDYINTDRKFTPQKNLSDQNEEKTESKAKSRKSKNIIDDRLKTDKGAITANQIQRTTTIAKYFDDDIVETYNNTLKSIEVAKKKLSDLEGKDLDEDEQLEKETLIDTLNQARVDLMRYHQELHDKYKAYRLAIRNYLYTGRKTSIFDQMPKALVRDVEIAKNRMEYELSHDEQGNDIRTQVLSELIKNSVSYKLNGRYISSNEAIEQAMKIPFFKHLKVDEVESILGGDALGAYNTTTKIIQFAKNPHETTLPHEAFHAFVDLVIDEKTKKEVWDIYRAKYDVEDDNVIEEKIAQDFAEWYVNRNKSLPAKIIAFFRKILNKIKELLGHEDKVLKLFEEVLSEQTSKEVAKALMKFADEGGVDVLNELKNDYQKDPVAFTSKIVEAIKATGKNEISYGHLKSIVDKTKKSGLKKPILMLIEQKMELPQFKNNKKIKVDEFIRALTSEMLDMEVIETKSYADYGLVSIGREAEASTSKTNIINTNFIHGKKGHFTDAFDEVTTKDDLEIRKIPKGTYEVEGQTQVVDKDQYFVVKKGLSRENLEEGVFAKFDTEEEAQEYINNFADRMVEKAGMLGHFRMFRSDNDYFVSEIQSDVFQNDLSDLYRANKRFLGKALKVEIEDERRKLSNAIKRLRDSIYNNGGILSMINRAITRYNEALNGGKIYRIELTSHIDDIYDALHIDEAGFRINIEKFNKKYIKVDLEADNLDYPKILKKLVNGLKRLEADVIKDIDKIIEDYITYKGKTLNEYFEYLKKREEEIKKKYEKEGVYFRKNDTITTLKRIKGLLKEFDNDKFDKRALLDNLIKQVNALYELNKKEYFELINKYDNTFKKIKFTLKNGDEIDADKLLTVTIYKDKIDLDNKNNIANIKKLFSRFTETLDELENAELTPEQKKEIAISEQFLSLKNNYHEIIINTAIRDSAMSGSEYINFPTPMTVAFVEGYVSANDEYEDNYRMTRDEAVIGRIGTNHLSGEGIVVDKSDEGYTLLFSSAVESSEIMTDSLDDFFKKNLHDEFNGAFQEDDYYIHYDDYSADIITNFTNEYSHYFDNAFVKNKIPDEYINIFHDNMDIFEMADNIYYGDEKKIYVDKFRKSISEAISEILNKEPYQYVVNAIKPDNYIYYIDGKPYVAYTNSISENTLYTEFENWASDVDKESFNLLDIDSDEYRNIASKYGKYTYDENNTDIIEPDDANNTTGGFIVYDKIASHNIKSFETYEEAQKYRESLYGKERKGIFYKYLEKTRPDLEEYTDENGFTWWRSKITPEDKKAVIMFQYRDTIRQVNDYSPLKKRFANKNNIAFNKVASHESDIKLKLMSYEESLLSQTWIPGRQEEAYEYLIEAQKRLGIKFDVVLADEIFSKAANERRAYGATFDNTIALALNIIDSKGVAKHELVHLTLNNLDKIKLFKGLSKEKILTDFAKMLGYSDDDIKHFDPKDWDELEEGLAEAFEKYKKKPEQYKGKVRAFFARLISAIKKIKQFILAENGRYVERYFYLLAYGKTKSNKVTILKNNGILKSAVIDGVLDLNLVNETLMDKFRLSDVNVRISDIKIDKNVKRMIEAYKKGFNIEGVYPVLRKTKQGHYKVVQGHLEIAKAIVSRKPDIKAKIIDTDVIREKTAPFSDKQLKKIEMLQKYAFDEFTTELLYDIKDMIHKFEEVLHIDKDKVDLLKAFLANDISNSDHDSYEKVDPSKFEAVLSEILTDKLLDNNKAKELIEKIFDIKAGSEAIAEMLSRTPNMINNKVGAEKIIRHIANTRLMIQKEKMNVRNIVREIDNIKYDDRDDITDKVMYLSEYIDNDIIEDDIKKALVDNANIDFAPNIKFSDKIRYIFADDNQGLKVLIRAMKDKYGEKEVDIADDFYLKKDLLPRKISSAMLKINQLQKEIIEKMKEKGIDYDILGKYLHARHAKERNKLMNMARGNNDYVDGLSGMTDKQAEALLRNIPVKYKEFAEEYIYPIVDSTVDFMYDSGLLSEDEYTAYKTTYKYYVPLYRYVDDIFDKNTALGSSGVSIVGTGIKRAYGSKLEVVNPVSNIFYNLRQAHIRALRNEVGVSIIRAVSKFPELKNIFDIRKMRYIPVYDRNGEIRFMQKEMNLDANEIGARIDGKQYIIKVKQAKGELNALHKAIVESLKNTHIAQLHVLIATIRVVTKFLASVYTRFNPEFMITNMQRDTIEAMINISVDKKSLGKKGKGLEKEIIKDIFPSMKEIWKHVRGKKTNADVEEFFSLGGDIGHFWSDDIEEANKSFEKIYERATKEDVKTRAINKVSDLIEIIDNANTAVELAVRYATYKALVKRGVNKEKAVYIASDLTINFARKGAIMDLPKALYVFAQPAVSGADKIIRTISDKKGRSVVARRITALIALGFIFSAISDSMDEEGHDTMPKFARDMTLTLPIGDGKRITLMYLPYGYNVFAALGSYLYDYSAGKIEKSELVQNVFRSTLNAFSPVPTETAFGYIPTPFKPLFEVYTNKGWFGGKIYPEQKYTRSPEPDSRTYKDNTSYIAVLIAQLLNDITGGDDRYSGFIDIHPNSLQYLYEQYTGGLGKFLANTINTLIAISEKGKINPNEIPFVRKVYRQDKPYWFVYDTINYSVENAYKKRLSDIEIDRFYRAIDIGLRHGIITKDYADTNIKNFIKARYGIKGRLTEPQNIKILRSMDPVDRKRLLSTYSERTLNQIINKLR